MGGWVGVGLNRPSQILALSSVLFLTLLSVDDKALLTPLSIGSTVL